MKRIFIILAIVLLTVSMFAQSPEKMSYQAVVRNASNNLITNTDVGMQISILQGSATGTAVYVETQTPTTNANGLVSIEIGGQNATIISGDFTIIDWANDTYFIKTETDPAGGTNYTITGTSQLLSVPYALYAKTAESITGTITETDPVFGTSVAGGITATDTTNWNKKLDNYTETDPVFGLSVAGVITAADTTNWNNKLDSYTETDPVFGLSVAGVITAADTTNWNNKLDSYTEADPLFTAWDKSSGISITESQISNLDHFTNADETDPVFGLSVASEITAIDTTNWNNKLDSYTETDPVFGPSVAGAITQTDTTNWNNKLDYYTEIQNLADVLVISNSANSQIKNVTDPTDDQDAVTKTYVDLLEARIEALELALMKPTDYDGNTYNIVKIGNQIWMAENLKTTHYVNGTEIPLVIDNTAWSNLTTPAYCWYNNDSASYANTYGALYNWYSVETGNLCPTDWHVPTDEEWKNLEKQLGMSEADADNTSWRGTDQGRQLKKYDDLWNENSTNANAGYNGSNGGNPSGFAALPGGRRHYSDGSFFSLGNNGDWWSNTSIDASSSWYRVLYYGQAKVYRNDDTKVSGISIRCVKD
ncbi:MAG: fibrobacter succinogenes major paralogous domain-containing protein [Bacteroidales bacterium]|nr:fibrobacter succinogenes major paralogous domain-containing protein [Bacteroidales bacterium]